MVVCGLHKYENKMSVVNFAVHRVSSYTDPVKVSAYWTSLTLVGQNPGPYASRLQTVQWKSHLFRQQFDG